MLTSSVSLPLEMLIAAADVWRRDNRTLAKENTEVDKRGAGVGKLNIETLALHNKTVRTKAGLTLQADRKLNQAIPGDLIILPTFWRNPLRSVKYARALQPWLEQAMDSGKLVCTVSTGSFLLAETGLLAGRAATTHWFYMDKFAARYPSVLLQRHHLITQSDSIYCAGSINSVADLMIHLIGQHFSPAIARQVESQFSPEIRRTYRDTLYVEGDSQLHHDEVVAAVQDRLNKQSSDHIDIAGLASSLGISVRSLNRRFKKITGNTPLKYLQHKRMSDARELLAKTDLLVAEVALNVGYEDASYFSGLFKQHMQLTPAEYRKSVRGKLFSTF
ncbi:MAG: GlxA family transcriptional regulator [Pseudomonadales bacterium]